MRFLEGFECRIHSVDGIQESEIFWWVNGFSINYICAQISDTLSQFIIQHLSEVHGYHF